MKKIMAIMLITAMTLAACACNYKVIDTNWEFNVAYISCGSATERVEIKSWTEDGNSDYTIETKDGRVLCTSKMNVVLAKEDEVEE